MPGSKCKRSWLFLNSQRSARWVSCLWVQPHAGPRCEVTNWHWGAQPGPPRLAWLPSNSVITGDYCRGLCNKSPLSPGLQCNLSLSLSNSVTASHYARLQCDKLSLCPATMYPLSCTPQPDTDGSALGGAPCARTLQMSHGVRRTRRPPGWHRGAPRELAYPETESP